MIGAQGTKRSSARFSLARETTYATAIRPSLHKSPALSRHLPLLYLEARASSIPGPRRILCLGQLVDRHRCGLSRFPDGMDDGQVLRLRWRLGPAAASGSAGWAESDVLGEALRWKGEQQSP